jgi:hypothetical protein
MIYDRLLIEVRERSFLDLVDLTFCVVRERPVPISLAALTGILPCVAANYALEIDPLRAPFFFIGLLILEVPLATAPLTVVLGDLMFDVPPAPRRIFRALLGALPSLVFAQLILRGVLLLTVVGYFFFPSRYAFLDEVILLERLRWFKAVGRAGAVCRGREGEYFLSWIGQITLGVVFVVCFATGGEAIVSVLLGAELSWSRPETDVLSEILFQGAVWIAVAYFGTFRFLSYIDRRIRLEGWELELRLKATGAALEQDAA